MGGVNRGDAALQAAWVRCRCQCMRQFRVMCVAACVLALSSCDSGSNETSPQTPASKDKAEQVPTFRTLTGPATRHCKLSGSTAPIVEKGVVAQVRAGASQEAVSAVLARLNTGGCNHTAGGTYELGPPRRVEVSFYGDATLTERQAVAKVLKSYGYFTMIDVAS